MAVFYKVAHRLLENSRTLFLYFRLTSLSEAFGGCRPYTWRTAGKFNGEFPHLAKGRGNAGVRGGGMLYCQRREVQFLYKSIYFLNPKIF